MDKQMLSSKGTQYKDLFALAMMTFAVFMLKAIWAVLISSGPLINDELLYKFNASAIFAFQKYYTAHYPPAYSLMLAPAFFFENWYEGMLVLNAFWSSLVVPAAWLLARTAGVRQPLLAAALAALLPMQVVYPNILFSENLFVPLFVLAMALALRGGKRGNVEALIFGFVLGITHLTKYLFLPVLPLLFGAWLYSQSKDMPDTKSKSLIQQYIPVFLVLASYGVVMGTWLIYGLASGFNLSQLLGLGISGGVTKAATGGSLIMWVVAYSSYVILAWLPVWGIIAIWLSQQSDKAWRIRPEPQHERFLILSLLLLGCYWLVAVQHSFGAGYNYPLPKYMLGRYLMHISPIMLVVGVWVLERIADNQSPCRRVKALISIGVLICIASVAWWILLNKGIWPLSSWYIVHVVNSVDATAFVSPLVFVTAIVIVLLFLAIICVRRNNVRLLALPIVAFMLVSLGVDAGRMHVYQNGLHYRQIAYAVANLNDQGDALNIYTNSRDLSPVMSQNFRGKDWAMIMNQKRLSFWGVKQKQISIQDISTRAGFQFSSIKAPTLLISNTLFDIRPVREYIVNNKTYYIYRIDGLDPKVLRSGIFTMGKDGK
jgi:4-amino-4-deoxy-L-arabinose transferase-like glycosyltransferase